MSGARRARGPKHPGVTLVRPQTTSRTGWRARFRDPDTGKYKWDSLDAGLATTEQRVDWAVRKSKALARRRLELEGGAVRATRTDLGDAIERYFDDHPHLRPRTSALYRGAVKKLVTWSLHNGVKTGDDITLAKLIAFRASLIKQPKRAPCLKGRRGAFRETVERRKPGAVNVDLRAIRTILGYLRRLGLLAHVTSDTLTDGLAKLPTTHEQGGFLRARELQRLLLAAQAHDERTYAATREEYAGRRPQGTTFRYEPVAPLVAAAVLTGMRIGELLDLRWSEVDLAARGDDGQAVGEICLSTRTKTKRARTVGLEVSPLLRELLSKLEAAGNELVFPFSRDRVKSSIRRLLQDPGCPKGWSWNTLRRTCGTFLTCAPGIFGAASAYRSARQLGHSVAVAEKHYVGVLRGIPHEARSLEDAMGVECVLKEIITHCGKRFDSKKLENAQREVA